MTCFVCISHLLSDKVERDLGVLIQDSQKVSNQIHVPRQPDPPMESWE